MSTVWNGSDTISIGGAGNTLASMYADINDDTVMSNPSTGLYEVDGNKGRYINISNDGELIIGNPNDFSEYQELRHVFSGANSFSRFYVYEGGSYRQYGNSEFILNYNCTASQYPQYSYIYGRFHMEGDDTYQPTFRGARRIYFYNLASTEAWTDISELTLYKCRIGECHGSYIYMRGYNGWWRTFNVEDVTLINDLYTANQYGINCFAYGLIYDIPPFKNMHVDNTVINNVALTYGGTLNHIKDTTIVTTRPHYMIYQVGGTMAGGWRYPSKSWHSTDENMKVRKVGQWIDGLLDNVDIQTTYAYQFYVGGQCQLVLKDCPNTNGKRQLIYDGSSMLFWRSDNCFDVLNVDNDGAIAKKVYMLDITTKDSDGNILPDCDVYISQVDEKEFFQCKTDENGKIYSRFGLEGVLLANAIRITTSETLEYWSDDSNSTYHTVTVSKDGYLTSKVNYVMDEDKTIEVQLDKQLGKIYLGDTLLTKIALQE